MRNLPVIMLSACLCLSGLTCDRSTPGAAAPATGPTPVLADIGINLYANIDWGTARIWADAGHDFRPWGMPGEAFKPNPALRYTAEGYPIDDAETMSNLNNYPDGTYKLTYRGGGEVLVHGIGKLSNIVRKGDAVIGDVSIKHDNPDGTGGSIFIDVRNNPPGNPVHDLHLWLPGAQPGELFAAGFVRRVRPFTCLRMMDWAQTNNSPVEEWSQRSQPENMIQYAVAWEYQIALANLVHRDLWINVPVAATDDYVTHLATLMRDKLDPALHLRVEYSNEVWNAMFKQFGNNMQRSRDNVLLTATDDFGRAAQQYAVRAKQIGDIFRQVFAGPAAARFIAVYGGQCSNTYWVDTGMKLVEKNWGKPSGFFQEVAIAPYVGNDLGDAPAQGWTPDTMFPALETITRTTLAQWVQDAHKSAEKWGMTLVAYEGGQHVSGNDNLSKDPKVAEALKNRVQNDPRMYDLYRHILAAWNANGGGLFCAFSHIGGGWGLLSDDRESGSEKWDAVMSMLLPPGDINLDGKVDFEDFVVLRANYGKTNAWRQDGDLNHDHVVDEKDLAILESLLKDLTPTQKAQLEAFKQGNKR